MSFYKKINNMPSSKLYLHLLIVKLLYVIEGGILMELRTYLSDERLKKGYSMRKVARLAGLSYQHYALIENGIRGNRISFMIMTRIAEALELSLDYISLKEKEYQVGINNGDY
jgi:hypothetical protein